jgi:hypothetical protein
VPGSMVLYQVHKETGARYDGCCCHAVTWTGTLTHYLRLLLLLHLVPACCSTPSQRQQSLPA